MERCSEIELLWASNVALQSQNQKERSATTTKKKKQEYVKAQIVIFFNGTSHKINMPQPNETDNASTKLQFGNEWETKNKTLERTGQDI